MFTVEYFIRKFEAIPEREWTVGEYRRGFARCALGHCGWHWNSTETKVITTPEGEALQKILGEYKASEINDYCNDAHPEPSAKQRILAALKEKL